MREIEVESPADQKQTVMGEIEAWDRKTKKRTNDNKR